MSWMSDNYEKVALGGGAVVALALAFFGWSASASVEEEFSNPVTGRGDDDTAVPGAELVPGATSSMKSEHLLAQAVVEDRPLDLFTGIALFARKGESDPQDPYSDPPVHPPIDNRWFLDNRIDLGFADSPDRDPDGDGYSNLEEFLAKTDPADAKEHPALVMKLSYVDQDVITWLLRWTSDISPEQNQFKFMDSRFRDSRGKGKEFSMRAEDVVAPGGVLKFRDEECPANGRFRFVNIEERTEHNERLKTDEQKKFAIIEDLKENKKGDKFEIPRRVPKGELPKLAQSDRTAVFELKAAGFEGKRFKIEERTEFALPPDAAEKMFFLKEVTDEAVTVEIRDPAGNVRPVVIPKGGFPDLKQ